MAESRRKRSPAAGIPKRFSDGQWDMLVDSFRQNPGDCAIVSEQTGIKRARVFRAWHHGYPNQGRPPISQLLDTDKLLARAKRAEMTDAEEGKVEAPAPAAKVVKPVPPGGPEPEVGTTVVISAEHKRVMAAMLERDKQRRKALEDSSRTRAEEGRLIQMSRRNVMSLGLSAAKVLRGAELLAARMETQLASTKDIPLKEAMGLIQKASVIVRLGTEAGKMAVQMERLAMGQPIGDGTDVPSGGKLSPEEAERWIETTVRALERSKRRQRDLDDEASSSTLRAEPEPRQLAAPEAGTVRVGRPSDSFN